jgi:hypothetical protein
LQPNLSRVQGLTARNKAHAVLGIKGVYYIGSIQPPLDIWKNNKKAESVPTAVPIEWLGNILTYSGELASRIVLDRK